MVCTSLTNRAVPVNSVVLLHNIVDAVDVAMANTVTGDNVRITNACVMVVSIVLDQRTLQLSNRNVVVKVLNETK